MKSLCPLCALLFNRQINPVFWQTPDAPEFVAAFQAWVYGVLGATMSGWGICLAFMAHPERTLSDPEQREGESKRKSKERGAPPSAPLRAWLRMLGLTGDPFGRMRVMRGKTWSTLCTLRIHSSSLIPPAQIYAKVDWPAKS